MVGWGGARWHGVWRRCGCVQDLLLLGWRVELVGLLGGRGGGVLVNACAWGAGVT